MEIKASVLLPVYERSQYTGEAIKSILTQTYPNFDLLVAYDEGINEIGEIAESFKDKRVQLLRFPHNTGISSALNWGLAEVDSPYIIRMDADSIARPDRLAKQIEYMEQHRDVGVCGSFVSIKNGHEELHKFPEKNEEIEAHLLFDNPLQHSSVILRSSLFQERGFRYRDKYEGMEDHDLWLRLKGVTKFANIGAPLLQERANNKQELFAEWRDRAFYFFVEKLPQFGIEPTSKELRLHIELTCPQKIEKLKSPLKYKAWLNRLKTINFQKKIFDQECFDRVLDEKWQGLWPYMLKQGQSKIIEYMHVDGKSRWEIARFIVGQKVRQLFGK